ncbi:MAG: nickel-dependent lactate racemase [Sedimentisphaerales bacterium]|nr:nickel-dependent lactate racemase [Sedimentisphaerales bacterium]
MKEVRIPYGHGAKTVRVPEANLAWVVGPKYVPPVKDLVQAVRAALAAPIGTPSLKELVAQHGTKTMILVDDGTRNTPQKQILPVLLEELNAAGVADSDITVMIALGTHRPMNEAERARRYGQEVVQRVNVINLPQGPDDFEDLGTTPSGVPIHVSRLYLESEISIAVGNVVPHMYAGWAGGAKMVQPGVTSHVTTAQTHLMAGPRVYEILGQVDNPVRQEMEEIALRTGLTCIVNVVLNAEGEIVAVVAGHPVKAHRAGVDIAKPIYTVELDERPDIVIAGAHPADRDLWQGFKPVNGCGMLVKDGGTLILVTPAPEGIAPDHPLLVELGTTDEPTVHKLLEAGKISDGVAAATYLALSQTRKRIEVVVVTDGFTNEEASRIGLSATTDFDQALADALARHGKDARIGVVTQGADIMARFKVPAAATK